MEFWKNTRIDIKTKLADSAELKVSFNTKSLIPGKK
jgi:hypothetical protein